MSVFRSKMFKKPVCLWVCAYVIFLAISDLFVRRVRLPIRVFRMEGIAQIEFSWKPLFVNSRMHFCCFFEASGTVFLIF